jgi:hypothetical protein
MSERAGIFESGPDFDVSGFAPAQAKPKIQTPPEAIRAVAETSDFRSREPSSSPKKKPAERERRRYTTGRNVQLNIKVRSETLDRFYALADRQGWVLGETLERAVSALEKELGGKRSKPEQSPVSEG